MLASTVEKINRFVEVWPEADSLKSAHALAETGINDPRAQLRFRRKAEAHLGVTLEPHQSQLSTDSEIDCPSTLDVSAARKRKRFVITSHTNNSPIDQDFFDNLLAFCEYHDAQLIVIPVRYKNPNSIHRTEDYSWDSKIYPYVLKESISIGRNFVINGALRIQATAVNPLSGLEPQSRGMSAAYGHPIIEMKPIPTPKNEMTRFMHTTGSLNKGRYSSTKAGGASQFHHSIGALFVNVVGSFHYPMQLNWNGSGFHHLNDYWSGGERMKADPALALVSGDIHADWELESLTKKKNQLMDLIDAEAHVLHDLHNHTVGSHHNTLRERIEMAMAGKISVEEEAKKSIDYVARTARKKNLIVGANHNDHMDQWLERFKEKEDPYNAPFAAWLKFNMYGTDMSALETFFNSYDCDFDYEFIPRNKSYLIGGVDVSQHGDDGVNGARGTTAAFAKTCRKVVKGHDHTPAIVKGAYSTGFSFDESKAEYAKGYGTWAQADVIIYSDGKRSHFFYGPNQNPPQLK